MSNMSYCRFENTFNDLLDCQDALDTHGLEEYINEANQYERPYIEELIHLCKEIAEEYGDET